MTSLSGKIFTTDSGQAVELPAEFRFEGKEVFVRRDPKTGDVILSRKPDSWDGLLQLHQSADVPDDFMGPSDRIQPPQDRDPFEGWTMLDTDVGESGQGAQSCGTAAEGYDKPKSLGSS